MRQYLIAATLACAPAVALSQPYEPVGSLPDRAFLVDVASIQPGPAISQASLVMIRLEPNDSGAVVVRFNYEVDCPVRRARYLSTKHFNSKLEFIADGGKPEPWAPIAKGTVLGYAEGVICAGKRSRYAQTGDLTAIVKRWREEMLNSKIRDTFMR